MQTAHCNPLCWVWLSAASVIPSPSKTVNTWSQHRPCQLMWCMSGLAEVWLLITGRNLTVHMDVAAAMTGVSRFGEHGVPWVYSKVGSDGSLPQATCRAGNIMIRPSYLHSTRPLHFLTTIHAMLYHWASSELIQDEVMGMSSASCIKGPES